MRDSSIFILHPDTGIPCSVPEVSKITGVPVNTIYGRVGRGDKGHQIWRPVNTWSKNTEPGNLRPTENHLHCKDDEKYII